MGVGAGGWSWGVTIGDMENTWLLRCVTDHWAGGMEERQVSGYKLGA